MDKIDMVFQLVSDLSERNSEEHREILEKVHNQRVKLTILAVLFGTGGGGLVAAVARFIGG